MIERGEIQLLVKDYGRVSIATIGSHSALDISEGAKGEGLKSIVLCQKGREKTYERYYKARKRGGEDVGVIDEIIMLEKFRDMAKKEVVEKLQKENAVFIPNRSFEVYVGYDAIENEFNVPIFGSRSMLRAEERDEERNQYYLLEKAGIRIPRRFRSPGEIDGVALVKAPEARRSYERAFFFASSPKEYEEKAGSMLKKGDVTEEGLRNAVIEEYVVGAQYNFNYFYSPVNEELELLGVDTRRQTNLDGLLRLPAKEQLEVAKYVGMRTIEVGHIACTLRESLLEKVFEIGERFVEACKKEYPPGIIGPFALQGTIVPEESGEVPVIFDVSLRVPGSPGTRFTPYTEYLYGKSMSVGKRIAVELRRAKEEGTLEECVT
ncbi:MAG: formate--phosphoribosylaminoimidazolecarboxamide ligase family protein [Candidatus Micrarchaeota archaeon]